MRIISFDVGMKNLAYCLFTIPDDIAFTGATPSTLMKHIKIERWDVIDLRFEPNSAPCEAIPAPKRTCTNDGKLAKWITPNVPLALRSANLKNPVHNDSPSLTHESSSASETNNTSVLCNKCAEKSKFKIPSREILPIQRNLSLLDKKKLTELMDIKEILSSPQSGNTEVTAQNLKVRKADLIQDIKTNLARDFLEPFDEAKYLIRIAGGCGSGATGASAKPKKANYLYAHDLDLITYGRNMMKHLDAILFSANTDTPVAAAAAPAAPGVIDMMIIENQISTLASRMKTLQGMITQYFIMKNTQYIEFISASCKLKLFTTVTSGASDDALEECVDASTYADRKKSGIIVCRSLGEISRKHNSDFIKWIHVFEKHKKKDDLADCFLQGLWRVHSAEQMK